MSRKMSFAIWCCILLLAGNSVLVYGYSFLKYQTWRAAVLGVVCGFVGGVVYRDASVGHLEGIELPLLRKLGIVSIICFIPMGIIPFLSYLGLFIVVSAISFAINYSSFKGNRSGATAERVL